jgi:hypothetical protein
MNEFDFDKNFGRDLGNERPFEPSEPGWEKVAARLDALETRRLRPRKALLWVPLLAALAALGFLGRALQRSERRAGELESEVGRLRSELSVVRTVSQTDTLYRQVTVVRYDTVYRRLLLPDHSTAWDGMAGGAPRLRSGDSLRSPAVAAHKHLPETDDYPDLRSRDIFPGRPALTPVVPERPGQDGADARVAFLPPAGKSRLEYLQELRLPNQGLLMVSVPQETPYRKLARRFRAQHLAIGPWAACCSPTRPAPTR